MLHGAWGLLHRSVASRMKPVAFTGCRLHAMLQSFCVLLQAELNLMFASQAPEPACACVGVYTRIARVYACLFVCIRACVQSAPLVSRHKARVRACGCDATDVMLRRHPSIHLNRWMCRVRRPRLLQTRCAFAFLPESPRRPSLQISFGSAPVVLPYKHRLNGYPCVRSLVRTRVEARSAAASIRWTRRPRTERCAHGCSERGCVHVGLAHRFM